MDQAQSSTARIEVDVVVIGGGIQGLWLLGDLLKAGYNAILLERMQPGFGQTGHSHVFLHQGHIYAGMLRETEADTIARIEYVQNANKKWQDALQSGRLKGLQPITSTFYMAFSDPENGEKVYNRCRVGSLTCKPIEKEDIPADFGPTTEQLYEAEGMCLDSHLLLTQLLQSGNLTDRVGLCEVASVQPAWSGRFKLLGKRELKSKDQIEIDTGAVVLSAGSGNEYMQGLFGLNGSANGSKQQTVKTFMLVIREINKPLPPTTGMHVDFDGLFVVSRKDPAGKTVWLVGDKQRELVRVPGDIVSFDQIRWFRNARMSLDKLYPKLMKSPQDYEWGIYEAAKAEPWTQLGSSRAGKFPGSFHFKRVPGLPIWLAWPTLLTFAPLVAELIANDLGNVVTAKSVNTDWSEWHKFRVPLAPENCRWKKTPLLSWQDFERCYA
jgi:glycine/D-amino acid oxidase-like deaminating enzyme